MLTLALLLMTGCTTTTSTELTDRTWSLAAVDGIASLPSGVATPTIRFGSDGRVSGNTGCNGAGGGYELNEQRLTIGPLTVTRRACAAREGNELEHAYIRAVEATRQFRIAGGELELLDASGAVVARFR
jgi:heat shock protein HslJ